jgi:hypothetical protein
MPPPGTPDAYAVCRHVKAHVPDHGPGAGARAKYARDRARSASPPRREQQQQHQQQRYYHNTPVDEQGRPTGLSRKSVLVLRNLARQMVKIDRATVEEGRDGELVLRHFLAHQERLFYVRSNNYSLREYMPELVEKVSYGIHFAAKMPKLEAPSGD